MPRPTNRPTNRPTSRREFLKIGLGALPVISLGSAVPLFVPKFAHAGKNAGTQVPDDNILVVLQLSGGNDGLNTLVPFGSDVYAKARGGLRISEDKLLRLDGYHADQAFGLHPSMTGFKGLWDEGKLAVIHGCGYPKPNRSHFESMHIWHTADPSGGTAGGWLGHLLDHLSRGTTHDALRAINVGNQLPQALVNDEAPVPSLRNISDFGIQLENGYDKALEKSLIEELNAMSEASPAHAFLSRQATNAIISAEEMQKLTDGYTPDAEYPRGLGDRLKTVAQIIAGGFGTRLFYVEIGGFDTHRDQANQHANLLGQVSGAVTAFLKDLEAKKLGSKVTVMCFSEFGRRVKPNGSNGTDHGAAGPMFVAGAGVKGGQYGTPPSLTDLDADDLKFTTDFRSVYASVLEGWLNCSAADVLKGAYKPLPIF
ncbi:MAG: DUF1501 domain-containing protein [Phycisphaerae bacterium]